MTGCGLPSVPRWVRDALPPKPPWLTNCAALLAVIAILGTSWQLKVAGQQSSQDELEIAAISLAARETVERALPETTTMTRADAVVVLEERVLAMARSRHERGYYEKPVVSVTCAPDDGVPVTEATGPTTTFECNARTREPDGGGGGGYTIPAYITWDAGAMAWG